MSMTQLTTSLSNRGLCRVRNMGTQQRAMSSLPPDDERGDGQAHHQRGDAGKLPGGERRYLPKYRCVNVAMNEISMNKPTTASIAAITVSGSSSVTL